MSDYLALCYHYIRPPEDPYPKLLGTSEVDFRAHIHRLKEIYDPIGLDAALAGNGDSKRPRILFTFDDGLADHHRAGQILNEEGISAVFFIPTCVLTENLPPNPTVIHYALAIHPIHRLLETMSEALGPEGRDANLPVHGSDDDAWETINRIKAFINYEVDHGAARRILMFVYKSLVEPELPEGLATMHLTRGQVEELIDMGHSVGVHSHSHVSIGSADLSPSEWDRELIAPKAILEEMFAVPVRALSYPFGRERDCLKAEELITKTSSYEAAYTVREIVNTPATNPLELGRYMPQGTDDADRLAAKLREIETASAGRTS